MHLPVISHPADPDASIDRAEAIGVVGSASDRVSKERSPTELLAWALNRFLDRRLVITTGFGMEGCVMIDMLWNLGSRLPIHYLDTHFLFTETHTLKARLEARYEGLTFINAGTTLTPDEQARTHGPELWKTNPDACCNLRKVIPMRALLSGADAWITAIRRSQSQTRAAIRPVEWDSQFELVKINPLAAWSREEVWDYAVANGVPYNELHEQGYSSIGCTHCTRSVPGAKVTDYSRAGRWAGTGKTECGLHMDTTGSGI